MRDWAKARRERTRHLIELGGLIQKAGLVELVDDDRATLLGAFMELADRLRGSAGTGDDARHLAARWRRRGLRAFDADRDAVAHMATMPALEGPDDAQEEAAGKS
jgi:Conjugal transfer protein TraD